MAEYPSFNDNDFDLIKKIVLNTADMATGGAVAVQDEGAAVAQATTLNFTGAGVNATNTGAGVVRVHIPGGGGTGYTEVANYAALPAAAAHPGEIYVVLTPQGVIFINRQPAGLYRSDGVTWTWLCDLPDAYFAGYMQSANNLTDVGDAATSFNNIKQNATTAATGVVELATDGEVAANVVVQGNDSRLSNARTPTAHAASHQSGGTDSIKLDDLAAPDDNTDLDASTTKHGLAVKATAPAAGVRNVVAIDNGETAYKNTALVDNTNPAALGVAAPGTSLLAARRDHVHAMPSAADVGAATTSTKLDDFAAPDDNTDLNASTSAHGLSPKAMAPGAGLRNVLGIDNGETAHSDKALFDATTPADLGVAAAGTAMAAARRDHVHKIPTLSDLGIGNVTNDAQTKASIVPNTAPSAGEILVGSGTAYAKRAISGDATLGSTGALTITNSRAQVALITAIWA